MTSAAATTPPIPAAAKLSAVWQRLERVTDPELDEAVTELGFVTRADVDAEDRVHIEFRLPTYWCAANFAFMMADDMRREVGGLPWVRAVSVSLGEHMYADAINEGMAAGRSFQETFGNEADGDIAEVRQTFLLKAFQRRQAALLGHLVAAGHEPGTLVAMTLDQLGELPLDGPERRLVARYLDRRHVAGATGAEAAAFPTAEGDRLSTDGFDAYLKGLRRVGVNAEFNGALCRSLLEARYDGFDPAVREPTLVDFMLDRVPPRDSPAV